jgi:hypothetical protein
MGYSLEDRRDGVRIPGRPEILFCATQQSEWLWQPPAVCKMMTGVKAGCAWSWPLISSWYKGQGLDVYFDGSTYVFVALCLIEHGGNCTPPDASWNYVVVSPVRNGKEFLISENYWKLQVTLLSKRRTGLQWHPRAGEIIWKERKESSFKTGNPLLTEGRRTKWCWLGQDLVGRFTRTDLSDQTGQSSWLWSLFGMMNHH